MANNTMINGIEYGWSDVKVNLLGRTIEGVSKLEYGDKREKVNNYGRGSMPVSRGRGKYEAHAKITISMKEMEAIQNALPKGKRIQDIPMFDIAVSYDPEDGTSPIVNNTIQYCEFTDKKREVKNGDGEIEHELELIVGQITW
jgi:hypothetical protein